MKDRWSDKKSMYLPGASIGKTRTARAHVPCSFFQNRRLGSKVYTDERAVHIFVHLCMCGGSLVSCKGVHAKKCAHTHTEPQCGTMVKERERKIFSRIELFCIQFSQVVAIYVSIFPFPSLLPLSTILPSLIFSLFQEILAHNIA